MNFPDLYVTSELVVWFFLEDSEVVYVATKLCDSDGNVGTENLKVTADGTYYKHDDWKTGSSVIAAIRAYAESFWNEDFESSEELVSCTLYEISRSLIYTEGIDEAEAFLKSAEFNELDARIFISDALETILDSMKP